MKSTPSTTTIANQSSAETAETRPQQVSIKHTNNNSKKYSLFFIDDSLMIRKMLEQVFNKSDTFDLHSFSNGEDAIGQLSIQPTICVLDFHLSDDNSLLNGLEILENIRLKSPETKVIMLSNQNEIGIAVNCLKKGASDYVIKDDVMSVSVENAVQKITKSLELKAEIDDLSQVIKRDKLLIKGYFGIIIIMLFIIVLMIV